MSSDYTFKILLIGSDDTDKKKFLSKYTDPETLSKSNQNSFIYISSTTTIQNHSIDLKLMTLISPDKLLEKITKNDTRFKGTNGIILLFDSSKESTFIKIKDWLKCIENNVYGQSKKKVLVGDNSEGRKVVSSEEAKKTAQNFRIKYFEMNKNDIMEKKIKEIFDELVKEIIKETKKENNKFSVNNRNGNDIDIDKKSNCVLF